MLSLHGAYLKYQKLVILTTNNNFFMNLKYNRMDMKNRTRGDRIIRKPTEKVTQPQKTKLYKRKTIRLKRSPATRDFGTDLTNRPEPVATQVSIQAQDNFSTHSETTPYLPYIVEHLIHNDQKFTTMMVSCLQKHEDFGQSKISTQMRRVLLRWLMQVSKKFQVKDQTMQICVQLIDYVLLFQSSMISKQNFQLLGVAALFLASKYSQIHTFEANKYIYLCDGLYTTNQLFEMESLILTTINFNLQFPTLHQFTGLLLDHYKLDIDVTVSDLIKLSMFDCILLNSYKKQHLASVIIYFAAKINESSILRSKNIIEELGVPEQIFRECFKLLLGLYNSREELK